MLYFYLTTTTQPPSWRSFRTTNKTRYYDGAPCLGSQLAGRNPDQQVEEIFNSFSYAVGP